MSVKDAVQKRPVKPDMHWLERRLGPWAWKITRFLFLIGICYVFIFPVLYMLSVAVRPPDAVNDPSSVWIPHAVSFESIKISIELMDYENSAFLTLTMSVLSTIASLVSCALVGYGFARFRFPLKNLFFTFLIITIIVPPSTMITSSFINFKNMHLTETIGVFVVPALFASGLRSGLFVFIFRQFFAGMPPDLEEAARIDGSGYLKTFVRIIIPLAVPAFITVALFSFIWHWNEYYLSAIYFNTQMPLSVMLKQLQSALVNENIYNLTNNTPDHIRTYLQAGCLLMILPPLILYIFTQRYFTESIERTGIVG